MKLATVHINTPTSFTHICFFIQVQFSCNSIGNLFILMGSSVISTSMSSTPVLSLFFPPHSLLFSLSIPSPTFIPRFVSIPHLQDDHLRPLHNAPRGRARLVDYDVWSIGEKPALRSLHEGALPTDGAGLQEPVECLLMLTPTYTLNF